MILFEYVLSSKEVHEIWKKTRKKYCQMNPWANQEVRNHSYFTVLQIYFKNQKP